MIIQVLLFAAARDLTGRDAVEVEVAPPVEHGEAGAGIGSSAEEESAGNGNATCVLVSCIRQAFDTAVSRIDIVVAVLPNCG